MAEALLRVIVAIVRDGGVARHAVVPERDGSLFPLDADLEVLAVVDVLAKVSLSVYPISDTRVMEIIRTGRVLVLTVYRRFSRASDSSCFNPTMRLVKPGLT